MQNALPLLKKHFGYSSFQGMQEDIIKNVMNDDDVFVSMPTGGGKSLCYQLPSLMRNGITIVISPLISLMKDQVDNLNSIGVGASCINSNISPKKAEEIKLRLLQGKDKILYVAPERFSSNDFISFVSMLNITLLAIDEAHCISEWGHEFRPNYRNLKILKSLFPNVPLIALTATAVPEVQEDIIKLLGLEKPKVYKASFNRKNLIYHVRQKKEAFEQILEYVKTRPKESGIIYCQGRKTVENLVKKFNKECIQALPYHAGLPSSQRTENQEKFIRDDVEIIVATIAFGMGINKTNVRYVIHYDLPKSIEGYYQETGRAGRDGLNSDCILFYTYADKRKIEYFINTMRSPTKKKTARKKMDQIIQFSESSKCRRKFLLNYFGESYDDNCESCDNCINPREMMDGTTIAKKVLSASYDVNQKFGMNYITAMLTGKNKVYDSYKRKPSFGSGKEFTDRQWSSIIREIVTKEYITVPQSKYPILKLNEKSFDILYDREHMELTKPPEDTVKVKVVEEEGLFDVLRKTRKIMADAEHIPPYMVFPDSTLHEICKYYPQDETSIRKIHGMGDVKLKKYGKVFLRKIKEYCKENNIKSKEKTDMIPSMIGTVYNQTLALCNQGLSLEEIAKRRGFPVKEIAFHIESLMILGKDVPIDLLVTKEKQNSITNALGETKTLSKLKTALPECSEEEIRIMKMKYNSDKQ